MERDDLKDALEDALGVLDEVGIERESRLAAAALPFILGVAPSVHTQARAELIGTEAGQQDAGGEGAAPDSPIAKLSRWSGIDQALLEDAIYTQDDRITLEVNSSRLPDSKAGRQRDLAYAYLAVMRQGYDIADVPADDLNEMLREYAVLDQNVWVNLETHEGAFSRRGGRGNYTYRLTRPGLETARDVLARLFNAD